MSNNDEEVAIQQRQQQQQEEALLKTPLSLSSSSNNDNNTNNKWKITTNSESVVVSLEEEEDAGEDNDNDNDNGSSNNNNNNEYPVTQSKTKMFFGRIVLLFVAFLYASLNVSLRLLYALPGPPSPSALSCTRGWMSFFSILPLLLCNKNKNEKDDYEDENNNNNSTEEEIENSMLTEPLLPSSSTTENNNNNNDDDSEEEEETTTTSTSITITSVSMAGLELAFYNFSSQALSNIGVLTTPSARASFLGQVTVVMVPLFTYFGSKCCGIFGGSSGESQKLSYMILLGCLSSFLGLIVLAHDTTTTTTSDDNDTSRDDTGLGFGDILILTGSILWSIYIIRLGTIAPYYSNIPLQSYKNFYMAIFYSLWFVGSEVRIHYSTRDSPDEHLWEGYRNIIAWLWILYSAVGPGIVADILQQYGQTLLPNATESNLLLSMEPVFTSILGYIVLGENVDWIEKIGGSLLITGAILASI